MKPWWTTLATRIDGFSLRERVFLFLSLIAVYLALADTLWMAPARALHLQARQRFDANAVELQQLRGDVRLAALQPGPGAKAREELSGIKAQIASAERSIAASASAGSSAMTLPEVLGHFLRRHPALTLVRTANLAPDTVAPVGATAVGGAPSRVPSATRRGLEVTVAGPYPDLVRFVQSLEAALPDLRWGPFKLQSDQQAPQLSLQVYLVGGAP